ncbi:erythromycin esterase family protein [Actinoplanes sp. CA-252034]|uniref:erythromycin esterase family protein n=1 Tax=Actinoplanes sp. CA-252034 TaxID=3239906 RepID=UPI003D954382
MRCPRSLGRRGVVLIGVATHGGSLTECRTSGLRVRLPGGGRRPDLLTTELPLRAIGVVHRPGRERWANYVPTVLGERYDAFLWFAETRALRPLHTLRVDVHEPETYPSGV